MTLTSQAQAFLQAISAANPPQWQDLSPAEGRERFDAFDVWGPAPQLQRVEDHVFPGKIKVRLYADSEDVQPACMYFHGGGWVLGNIETHDALCRRLARDSGCTIVSVDYGLAPEHPYPKPLDDCFDATQFVYDNADALRIDAERIAVAGDSAGGNLAAAVALKARDVGLDLQLQVLIYPITDYDFDTKSYLDFATDHGLTRETMQWFWHQYIGKNAPDSFSAVIQSDSLASVAPAHFVLAQYDVLLTEGEAYAAALERAGVPTTTRLYEGNLHGFFHFTGAFDDGLKANHDVANLLRRVLSDDHSDV